MSKKIKSDATKCISFFTTPTEFLATIGTLHYWTSVNLLDEYLALGTRFSIWDVWSIWPTWVSCMPILETSWTKPCLALVAVNRSWSSFGFRMANGIAICCRTPNQMIAYGNHFVQPGFFMFGKKVVIFDDLLDLLQLKGTLAFSSRTWNIRFSTHDFIFDISMKTLKSKSKLHQNELWRNLSSKTLPRHNKDNDNLDILLKKKNIPKCRYHKLLLLKYAWTVYPCFQLLFQWLLLFWN